MECEIENASPTAMQASMQSINNDELFEFSQSANQPRNSQIQIQCALYSEEATTDLIISHKYPVAREVFVKFNSPIPSSAPVERLFSFGGWIHTEKRNRSRDSTFETLLLLKADASFMKKD